MHCWGSFDFDAFQRAWENAEGDGSGGWVDGWRGWGWGVGVWKGEEWGGRDCLIKLSFLLALCYIVKFQRAGASEISHCYYYIIARTKFLWDDHLMLHPQLHHSTTISQSTFYIAVQLVISLSTSLLLSARKYNTVSEWLSIQRMPRTISVISLTDSP